MGTRSALAIFTVASDAALGLRVERPAGLHRAAVVPAQRHHLRVPHRHPGDVLDGDRLARCRSAGTSAPRPRAQRRVQARRSGVPRVWSQVGITTRNRDQASHAQNSYVRRPPIRGPSPQSNCSHIPGSGTHGR